MSEFLLRPENPPTSEQITSFARSCILFAHRHGKLRKFKSSYRIGPMAQYTAPDVVDGEPFGILYEDVFVVHAKMDEVKNTAAWLKIIHNISAREISGTARGVSANEIHTDDVFRVVDGAVIESRRSTEQTMGGVLQDNVRLEDINIDNVHVPSDIAEKIAREDELKAVTEGDFAHTAREISTRMHRVDNGEIEFCEERKNYATYFDR